VRGQQRLDFHTFNIHVFFLSAAASLVVGIVSFLWERWSGYSALPPILAGTLLVVPGGIAVKSLQGAVVGNSSGALELGVQFLSVAVSIVVGLFVADLVAQVFGSRREMVAHEEVALLASVRGRTI